MKKITLWHKESSMPAFNETEAFFDGESEVPMEVVKEDDRIEEGIFITDSELQERYQAIWQAAGKNQTYKNLAKQGKMKYEEISLADFLKERGW